MTGLGRGVIAAALVLAWAAPSLVAAVPAHAGELRRYDRSGHYMGRSVTRDDEARHYDRRGAYAGRSVTKGGTTRHYDAQGRLIATTRTR